jgi:hypothetical protein
MFYSQATGGFYLLEMHSEEIPADAVEISAEEHSFLIEGQSKGKQIQPDENGYPILVDPPPIPVVERRATAKRAVDTAAGNARARYVSAGQLIEEEYRLALQQTLQWRTAGSPAESVPQAIQNWATAAGITAEEAATSIEQTAAAWETVLLTIRKLRLDGKVALDNAADDADFTAIAQPYIDQLNAMQP